MPSVLAFHYNSADGNPIHPVRVNAMCMNHYESFSILLSVGISCASIFPAYPIPFHWRPPTLERPTQPKREYTPLATASPGIVTAHNLKKIYNSCLYIVVLQKQPSYRAASILQYGYRKIYNFDIRTDLRTPTDLSAEPTSKMKPSAALSRDEIFLLFP